MPDLSPAQRRALQYWGPIESVTLAGGSTQELWAAINAQAEALGYDRAGISIQDVNRLRSHAVGMRNANDALGRLGPDDLITGPTIAEAPWARGLNEQNATPMWTVRFEHQVERNGERISEYRTSFFTGTLPRTRRELEEALEEDAANLANDYGVENFGVGEYTLLAA